MFVIVTLLCVFSIALLRYMYLKKYLDFSYITLSKVPGPPRDNIFIGSIALLNYQNGTNKLLTTQENIFKTLREWARIYYPIYSISVINRLIVNIITSEDCELLLSNPKHLEKSHIYYVLHDWLESGLLTSTGNKWFTRRKILTPAFHFSILRQFIDIFNEEATKLVENLQTQCHEPSININPHITQFTLKSLAESAMGTKLKFDSEKEATYKKAIIDIGRIYIYRILHPWLFDSILNLFSPKGFKERRTIKILHKFTKDVIEERQTKFQENVAPTEEDEVYTGKTRLAMLDLMLTAKNKEGTIDDNGIREEVDTFMFEGHDTVSMALGFALMLIACHKNVQDHIVEEMIEVLGDLQKKPTYNDLREMKYLERSIKEVLRMYPSVHFISRILGENMITSTGYFLPKNTVVNLHIYDLHHNPDLYPDPEKFDPDRFLPEISKNRHPFAYVPFSAGLRNCIGQKYAMLELKAAICGVLASFVLEAVDTPSTIVLVADIVLRTKEGIKVKFTSRI